MKRKINLLLIVEILSGVCANAQNRQGQNTKNPSYKGLVMAGYQGWFRAQGEGSDVGLGQYGRGGTVIMKISDTPPISDKGHFVDNDGVPSNRYLWLTGLGATMLRHEIPLSFEMPKR